jgi:hypothetical protein
VNLHRTNTRAPEHDFTTDWVAGTETLAAGAATTLEVDALDVGSYPLLFTMRVTRPPA